MSLSHLRREYERHGLLEDEAGADPFALFHLWFEQARNAGILEPNAMVLATVASSGQPSTRTVLLKAADARGFVFFSNYLSRKGRELLGNPRASLCFPWIDLERQVLIEGLVERTTAEESDAYFRSRPIDSRYGAWASAQSESIASRAILEQQWEAMKQRHPDPEQLTRPPHWGGYRLVPEAIEFWQGRPARLHDRLRFYRQGAGWNRVRLSP